MFLAEGYDGIIAISAGSRHSLALNKNGMVIAWGDNSGGQCDVPSECHDNIIGISAGRLLLVSFNSGRDNNCMGKRLLQPV